MFKSLLRVPMILIRLAYGAVFYLINKRTPHSSYVALIQLFCLTKGYGLDVISFFIGWFKSFSQRDDINHVGAVGQTSAIMDSRGVDYVVRQIRDKGFCVLDTLVNTDILKDILVYAQTQQASIRGAGKEDVYDPKAPIGVRYDFDPQKLLSSKIFNSLFASQFSAQVASQYLGCRPWLDVVSLWWHTSYSKEPDSDAAQLYHFDLDRVKWLKVFIYITDVGPESGPHCFIEGSHKSGVLPRRFLRSVYSRIEDKEVFEVFKKEKEKKFIGPRGTVIIEDTRGLHKGEHVRDGDRLIFQMQYSNSLFGMDYKMMSRDLINPDLMQSLDGMGLKITRN